VVAGLEGVSQAEVVVLKSGERFEGAIVERNPQEIKIEFEGVGMPLTYFLEDIASIDGVAVSAPEPEPLPRPQTPPSSAAHAAIPGTTSPSELVIVSSNQAYLDHITAGNNYSKVSKLSEAISEFTKAIEAVPGDPRVYLLRGVAYENQNNPDLAIADFTTAIGMDPNQPLAYSWRGIAYSAVADYDKAIADFTRALEINPRDSQAYYNRGVVYFFKKDYTKSYEDLSAAREHGYVVDEKTMDEMKKAAQSSGNDDTRSPG
jgi:tetratricopeptide (TPR) repeat protein